MTELAFQPLAEADLTLVERWLREPHVAEWWPEPDDQLAEIRGHLRPGPVEPFRVDLDGRPIGYIQRYDANAEATWQDQPPGTWGIDQFIGEPGLLGQGLGTRLVRAFVARTFLEKGAVRIITDPDPANARAIRCYEKAGFHIDGEVDTPFGRTLLMIIERETE